MYRLKDGHLQVFLSHPGGPLFRSKDVGAWTIPKGEVVPEEDLLNAARREFQEETGLPPVEPFIPLTPIRQKGGKLVHAWAFQGDCDPLTVDSNRFTMEWPPESGRMQEFPEVDRAEFFSVDDACRKINPAQVTFIEECERIVLGER